MSAPLVFFLLLEAALALLDASAVLVVLLGAELVLDEELLWLHCRVLPEMLAFNPTEPTSITCAHS